MTDVQGRGFCLVACDQLLEKHWNADKGNKLLHRSLPCWRSNAARKIRFILGHKNKIQNQIDKLYENMKEINYQIWYYETAIQAGTEAVHKGHPCNPSFEPDEIDEQKITLIESVA
jgi:hypothetical protein